MSELVPILIIADQTEERIAYRQLFARDQFRIFLCASVAEGLVCLNERTYACILCDLENPEKDAMQLTQVLRSDPRLNRIPLLFTSCRGISQHLCQNCFDCGLYDCLDKPFDLQLLRRKMRVFASLFMQRQKVEQQRSLLEAVLANTHEGVAVYDAQGEFHYRNAIWEVLCEADPAAVAEEVKLLRCALLEGRSDSVDLELSCRILCLRLRALSGEFAEGKVVATICDVTAERLQERRMRARQQELEMFAHVASHDLRAPLRHLTAFTEILSSQLNDPGPQVASTLNTIQAATHRLRGLVDCLQQYAEAGRPSKSVRLVSLEQVVRETWETLSRPEATLHLQGPLPSVFGSPSGLGQLLQNLLQNALKFVSSGRIPEVWIWSTSSREGVTLHVRDNGIGIPMQHRQRIFEVFQRLHGREVYAGDGIGLSVCQRVMEQHGGSIEVLSDGLTGSTFLLHFPRRVHGGALTGT
ncbi:response regulator [bacterium]|nr:response regulator [bacterium]